MIAENTLVGCLMLDNALIDVSVNSGLTAKHFCNVELARAFSAMLTIRSKDGLVDLTSLMLTGCDAPALMAAENAAPTQAHFQESLKIILEAHSAKTVLALASEIPDMAENRDALVAQVAAMLRALETKETNIRTTEQIGSEVEDVALAAIENRPDPRVSVEWPIAKANSVFSPIMPHELVGIAARPKEGKSSLALQLLGHNIKRGLRGAYFTLETADTAAMSLTAAQIACIDLQSLRRAPRDMQQKYLDVVRYLKNAKNLQIYEKEMSIDAIEAKCRLLVSTFKPHFVVIDHLHQVHSSQGRSNYEKLTDICLRLVELRKKLGCALICAIQLNRGSANEERPPRSSDARDSGAIEAAVHRMVLIYRPKNDFNDQPQFGPDVEQRSVYDSYLMQELNRDGPTGNIRARFNAPLSSFQSA